jgi:antitoxin component of RelBE/YafQ-DinJ toxin-antitoxin module
MLIMSNHCPWQKVVTSKTDPQILSVRAPNSETLKALHDAREGKTVKAINLQDLWKKLDI